MRIDEEKIIRYSATMMLYPLAAEMLRDKFIKAFKERHILDWNNGLIEIEANNPPGYLTVTEYEGSHYHIQLLERDGHIGLSCEPYAKHSLEIWDADTYDSKIHEYQDIAPILIKVKPREGGSL